jgi:hypothetical protein
MEPEGSLQCPQEPATGPYPEPDKSTTLRPVLRCILMLSYRLRLDIPLQVVPSGFLCKIVHLFLISRKFCLPHASPISFSFA